MEGQADLLTAVVENCSYADVAPLEGSAYSENTFVWETRLHPLLWSRLLIGGELAGSVGVFVRRGRARVRGWYVLPRFRGGGHGRALLAHAVERARAAGAVHIDAKTRYHYLIASCGWSDTGREFPAWPFARGRQYELNL
jgi:GNAT superfamily N-acetyltransferase